MHASTSLARVETESGLVLIGGIRLPWFEEDRNGDAKKYMVKANDIAITK